MTNVIMAGISGSAVADASAIGTALIPSMKAEHYRRGYPEAIIASGAMLGPILPPSIPMIVYAVMRSEEHTSELQSLMRISYAVFCLKKKNNKNKQHHIKKSEEWQITQNRNHTKLSLQ